MLIVARQTCRICFILCFLSLSFSVNAGVLLETVKDWRVLKEQAESAELPVLLLFTAQDCDYCEAIRSNYLEPMIRSGKYSSSILFRQLYIEDYSYVRDKNGELIGGDQVALKYDVDVTPTILFLDSDGNELTERLVGLSGADYFDKLLSTHISLARTNLNNK